MARPRVVILGGGMAGLVTAWELSHGQWRERLESITVYQRGWRLGGKGASSRGPHGRIEEHGLHVLLGYYDSTFRVLRQVYDELDRDRTDPRCPIRTWNQAVVPSGDVGLADRQDGRWQHFVTRFSRNDRVPGEPGAEHRPLDPLTIATRSLQLLVDFHRSLDPAGQQPRVYLSSSAVPRPRASGLDTLVRGAGLTALAALLEAVEQAATAADRLRLSAPTVDAVVAVLQAWRDGVRSAVLADPSARRTFELVDLVVTNLRGMVVDGLLSGERYDRIDHLDYREWLARHGAGTETLQSGIVTGMYDLVFAYEQGDRRRPRFAAGLGLQLATRMLLDFKGSIFWRMQAGMGEVVFAPLYQALSRRGVEVEFFHRLDTLERGDDGAIETIALTRQARLRPGLDRYDPLVAVDGLPCWPDRPLLGQLTGDPGEDAESHSWRPGEAATQRRLRAGEHFDVAVLAVSLGMVPHVAGPLVASDPRWQAMVHNVGTVATQSAQLWLQADQADLGWNGPDEVTLSGFGDTFDTWADMSHLIPRERWPAGNQPRSLAYFCGAMPDAEPAEADRAVRERLVQFLDQQVGALWPTSQSPDGFRWPLLWDDRGNSGSDRLKSAYLRANVDPSDRYVQSLPGSGRHRLAPGDSGVANLVLAGDWTACGLDAGCVEAATRSGVLAAAAVLAATADKGQPYDSDSGTAA